jgi:hypothetical protein
LVRGWSVNPEKVRLAVPASVQDISVSGLKYLVSITAAGNKYRFSTLRALTSQTNDITLSCATSPFSAFRKITSISIDQKTLYANRDLVVYSESALSSVPYRNMSSPSPPLTALPLEKPSLYAAFPYNAVQNIMSFSIDQKTLYANRDLFFSDYVIYPMVLCRKKVIFTILKVSFPKDNVFTQCLACKVKSCI